MLFAAADIGGTSCRTALFAAEGGTPELVASRTVPTASVHDTAGLHDAFEGLCADTGADLRSVRGTAVAVAGPVLDGTAQLTNAGLTLSEAEGRHLFPGCFRIINDFEAVSRAILSPEGRRVRHVCGPEPRTEDRNVRAAVGAGTGFGCSAILDGGGRPVILASEAGHTGFPFQDGEEQAFHAFLREKRNLAWVDVDSVVSGRGLEALHAFLTGEELPAAKIGARFLAPEGGNPLKTLFARFYARACRGWMLSTVCRGGLWIAGGIAIRNPTLITCPAFGEELVQGVYADLIRSMPVSLFTDPGCGLWGAAMLAASA